MNNIESNKGEIVMYQPDETIRYLQNIYDCDELKKKATSSILELVRKEGKRTVKRKVEFYNLDATITSSIHLSLSIYASAIMTVSSLSIMWSTSLGPA